MYKIKTTHQYQYDKVEKNRKGTSYMFSNAYTYYNYT